MIDREWQPIETAPKDWTRVILFAPSRMGRKVVEGNYGFNGKFRAWFCLENGLACKPTHWMPLPKAPFQGEDR